MFREPVQGADFFNRDNFIKLLEKRVDGLNKGYRQNVALLGQELVGKTSIILRLLENLEHNSDVLPIYFSVIPSTLYQFGTKFIGALLYYYLKSQGKTPSENMDKMIEEAQSSIPNTVDAAMKVQKQLRKQGGDVLFGSLLDILPILREEAGKNIVIVLDEFHRLGGFKSKNMFSMFGKKLMAQKDILYIVVSSAIASSKEIIAQDLSLLFGNFDTVEVPPFNFAECKEFISDKLGEVRISTTYMKLLINLTNGHPFYLSILCMRIKQSLLEDSKAQLDSEVLLEVLCSELFSSRGIIHQYIKNFIDRSIDSYQQPHYLSLLSAICNGSKKLSKISKSVGISTSQTTKQIDKLIERDLIVKKEKTYVVTDPMLKTWLKYVYSHRENSYEPGIMRKREAFKNEMAENLNLFSEDGKRSIAEQVRDLFVCFQNDKIEVGKKAVLLPQFSEVKAEKLSESEEIPLVAKYKKNYWVGDIKEGHVQEGEVKSFLENISKVKHKVAKKVLFCLSDIETDARLIAQEAGISIWGLKDLNSLLDIYGKPKIIRI